MIRLALLSFLILALPRNAPSQDRADARRLSYDVGLEFLWPTIEDRSISTVSAHALVGMRLGAGLSTHIGLSAAHGGGYIDNSDIGIIGRRESQAVGIGPMFAVRFAPVRVWRFGAGLDIAGSLLYFSSGFPHGGDHLNYMGRAGAFLDFYYNPNTLVRAAFRSMGFTSGRSAGRHNPGYSAQGICISISRDL